MSGESFPSWESAVRWLIDEPSQQALVKACYFDRPAKVAAERFWSSEEWAAVRPFSLDPKAVHLMLAPAWG